MESQRIPALSLCLDLNLNELNQPYRRVTKTRAMCHFILQSPTQIQAIIRNFCFVWCFRTRKRQWGNGSATNSDDVSMVPLSEHDEMMAMGIEFVRRSVRNKLYDKETSRARFSTVWKNLESQVNTKTCSRVKKWYSPVKWNEMKPAFLQAAFGGSLCDSSALALWNVQAPSRKNWKSKVSKPQNTSKSLEEYESVGPSSILVQRPVDGETLRRMLQDCRNKQLVHVTRGCAYCSAILA